MRTTVRTFAPALASAGKAETRFFASAVALIKTVLHGLRNRRAMAALYEFDDFQLNDIGLSRRMWIMRGARLACCAIRSSICRAV